MLKNENNEVKVSGIVKGNFEFSHEVCGEKFYRGHIRTNRASGFVDEVPILISERIVDVNDSWNGRRVRVSGQFRSYNQHIDGKVKVVLNVFVDEIEKIEEIAADENEIELIGFVCKAPTYRKTPLGREISDLLIAVDRPYGQSDYIPCVAWGRNARYTHSFEPGKKIRISGRVQSREYTKKLSENESEIRTAYEVSIGMLEVIEED